MDKKNFKADIQYRLVVLNITQKELAKRLNITEAYLSHLLKCISDTAVADVWREKIVSTLNELEKECLLKR